MLMINARDCVFEAADEFGGLKLQPNETVEIPDGYCDARLAPSGTRIPSIVERLAPALVPVDAELRRKWGTHLRVTLEPVEPLKQETERLVGEGIPPAAIALMQSGEVDPPRRKKGRNGA
jgi:hypothetical protein